MAPPIQARSKTNPMSPLERLTEAAISYANADSDDEYDRARDNLRKAASAFGNKAGEAIRIALADLRARGIKLGRPRKIEPEVAVRLAEQTKSIRKTALMLGVSRKTVQRALRQVGFVLIQ